MKGKLFVLALAVLGIGGGARAQQQVTPYGQQAVVMNQVVNPTVTPTGASAVTCHPPVTPGNVCEIQSLGQNVHYLTYSTNLSGSGNISALDIRLEGSFDNTNWFSISADATAATTFSSGNQAAGAICAVGYYPFIRANLVTFSGTGSPFPTLTALYAGTSSTSGCPKGTYNPSQDQTAVAFSSASDTTASVSLNAPFGNSFGTLYVNLASTHAGGSIEVNSLGSNVHGTSTTNTILGYMALPGGIDWEQIPLPWFPTNQVTVTYTSGGTSSGHVTAFIIFSPPSQPSSTLGCHITTATNTACKAAPVALGQNGPAGSFQSITINQVGSSGALATVYDGLISVGVCTGTVIATINVASQIGTFWYNQQFNQGLCVTTTGGTPADITVNYR